VAILGQVFAMTTAELVLLAGAGLLAGILGSAGGTASLISFPALLAVGIPPLQANVTNSVAFVAAWPGSALGSRPELRGQGAWLRRWGILAAAGGAAGATLLLVTPPSTFGRIVPILIAAAALLLLFQPRIRAFLRTNVDGSDRWVLPAGLLAASIYNGYWGAGAGVLTIAVLMLSVSADFAHANALKNMLIGVTDLVIAIAFTLFGPVAWPAAVSMAIGLFVGSMIGPSITRRVPSDAIRVLVGVAGLALAIRLWIAPV
jgi:uncharacterized protein